MMLLLFTDEFENRFRFHEDLPPAEIWKPGPKTYPSQNVQNKSRTGMYVQSINTVLAIISSNLQ